MQKALSMGSPRVAETKMRVGVWTITRIWRADGGGLGDQHGEGCRLVVERWRNAEKGMESRVTNSDVIDGVNGILNSSPQSFRASVSCRT